MFLFWKCFCFKTKRNGCVGRAFFYSVNRVFVFCQNKEFGCDWQGLYGDCAEHLTKSCFAVQPEQLLKRLEASEKCADTRTGQLAASRIAVDELKKENAKLKGDLDARTSLVRDLEAHVAALKENGSHMVIDLKKLEDENSFLRERNHAQLRDRNRLIWNFQEKLKLVLRKRGGDDDSTRRGGSPKRRRRRSSSARGSKQTPSGDVVDVEDERPAPWRCNDGSSPCCAGLLGKFIDAHVVTPCDFDVSYSRKPFHS